MPADEYAREMLNAFDAPVEGAYYTEAMNALQGQKRVCSVPVDLSQSLITGWDIGIPDFTCIWVFQLAGQEIHFVDYVEDRGHKADTLSRPSRQEGEVVGDVVQGTSPSSRCRSSRVGKRTESAANVDGRDAGSDPDGSAGERCGSEYRRCGGYWALHGLTSKDVGAGWQGYVGIKRVNSELQCMTMLHTERIL